MNIQSFFKTDKKEVTAIMVTDAVEEIQEEIAAQRALLTKRLRLANKELRAFKEITDIKNFDAAGWVEGHLAAVCQVATIQDELEIFDSVYSTEEGTKEESK